MVHVALNIAMGWIGDGRIQLGAGLQELLVEAGDRVDQPTVSGESQGLLLMQ